MNCATLQTTNYSITLFDSRTMYCTHYYHHHPLRHNAIIWLSHRTHSLQLPEHSTLLSDSNLLTRMLYTSTDVSFPGCELQYVQCLKYLGIHILSGKPFKRCVKNVRMTFYRTFNCIYYRSKGANSELVSVQLFKSYCLPFIVYATEAVSLNKSSVKKVRWLYSTCCW